MPEINVQAALRNIVLVLQAEPRKYRCFGVWWWPVKRLLRERYGRDQLYLLGAYEDAGVAAHAPDLPPDELLPLALEEFNQNDRYNLGRNIVVAPDGEPCVIFDEDAGV